MHKLFVLLLLITVFQGAFAQGDDFRPEPGDLVACGEDQVFILAKNDAYKGSVNYRWKWKVSDAEKQLPKAYQQLLAILDECKPVDNGTKLLLTASSGATVLLDIATKKVLFYAKTPMAHSADLLPGGRIAVANSTHQQGNSLEIYDLKYPEKVLYRDSLYSGHGVVWDAKHKQLLALGFDELRIYELVDWTSNKPKLALLKTYKLPDEGGHELSNIDNTQFLVSTHHGVWTFDLQKGLFEPFTPLAKRVNIKSANYNNESKTLLYTVAEESWWTFNIYGENPTFKLHIPEVKLYKVRVVR